MSGRLKFTHPNAGAAPGHLGDRLRKCRVVGVGDNATNDTFPADGRGFDSFFPSRRITSTEIKVVGQRKMRLRQGPARLAEDLLGAKINQFQMRLELLPNLQWQGCQQAVASRNSAAKA